MNTNLFYSNPLIFADVPDPDIIRTTDKCGRRAFYMVSTTMHLSPGVPVMKSFDLVHWETVNYVYERLGDGDIFSLKNGRDDYSRGSWAASLRRDEESGWFFVAFTCNTTQRTYIFMTEDIELGPWYRTEFPEMCYDNGMLFDEDGRKYIFFSEDCGDGINTHDIYYRELFLDVPARTVRFGEKQFVLHNSNYETPKQGLWGEGFHVYRHNGYYYLFAIQFQQWQRQELCWRSRSLTAKGRWDDEPAGGWECKKVFAGHLFDEKGEPYMKNNGIAQGGIVDTGDGKWYCFLFQDNGAVGRIPMLSPMHWGTEGEMKDWPVVGEYLGNATPFLYHKMPVTSELPVMPEEDDGYAREVGSNGLLIQDDDFENDIANRRCFDRPDFEDANGSYLKLQWQWNHNPEPAKWSLTERPGALRLRPVGAVDSVRRARNMLTVRTFGPKCRARVELDYSAMTEGMTAGLCAFQRQYGFVAVKMTGQGPCLVMQKADSKEDEAGRCVERLPLAGTEKKTVMLEISFDFTDRKDEAVFAYSQDGENWKEIGEKVMMKYDMPDFMGYRIGLFTFGDRVTDKGMADFMRFRFRRESMGSAICCHENV